MTARFGAPISILGQAGQDGAVGAVGPQGVQGFSILAGNGAPQNSLGVPGDIYVSLDAGDLYAPKTQSGWPTAKRSLIGPQGIVGPTGAALLSGYGPPDDALGSDGDSYFDSQNGSIFGPKASGAWGTDATSLIGPPGQGGEAGTIIYAAQGEPSDAQGRDGDFFINTELGRLFGPKANGTWGNALSLIGPQGATGSQGLRGFAGADGATIIVAQNNPTTEGKPGDVFINAATSMVFGPRGADGQSPWPYPGYSFLGAQGPSTLR